MVLAQDRTFGKARARGPLVFTHRFRGILGEPPNASSENHPWSSWYLQDRIGEEQAIPDNLQLLCGRAGHREELEDLLGGFRLPGSTFSGDQDEVVVVLGAHEAIGVVSNGVAGEDARRTE